MRKLLALAAVAALAVFAVCQSPWNAATTAQASRNALMAVYQPDRTDAAYPTHIKLAQSQQISPWSAGFVMNFTNSAGKFSAKPSAVVINDFRAFTVRGSPTDFYWSGFVGTTVDKDGHAVGGLGVHYVKHLTDQLYAGGFVGVDVVGGSSVGAAIGFDVGVRF